MFKFQVFCSIKLCTKNKYIIQFEQNLTYMSRTYETCNSTIRFSKFISNKKKYEKSLMGLEILERNLIYYLLFGPVLVPQLVNWDPFETSSEASKTILFTGILFIFQGILAFFFSGKQINCFQIMCFRKCGETLELQLILSTKSTLSALAFQRTA